MEQKVVVLNAADSYVLVGDPDETRFGAGLALPTLLAEGWTIVSLEATGRSAGSSAYVLVERDEVVDE